MLSNNTFYCFSVNPSLLVLTSAKTRNNFINKFEFAKKNALNKLKKQITIIFVHICISQSNEKILNNSLNIMLILYM